MSLMPEIKKRVFQAMKDNNDLEKDLLRVVLGDLELSETRKGEPLSEKEEQQIVRRMVKSTQETIALTQDPAGVEKLKAELAILEGLLPQTLGVADIVAALAPVTDDIKAAGNDGQATGVAMKHLKPQGLEVEGKDVAQAVKQIRS
ncbi:MAG: GatB/YqeY domain-containing protein [Planctomycetota bacterium]